MHKRIISSILLLGMMFLCACSIGGLRTEKLNKNNDEETANVRMEQVLHAIRKQDKKAFKSIFSKQSIADTDDFDRRINSLFNFFQGGVKSWKKSDGLTVNESNNYGHVTKEISSYYDVITDKQNYFFLLRDYPVDTDHPDHVGLYMLLVVKAADETKIWDGNKKILYDGNRKLSHAGIYIPIK
jgi:hypothetical protein